DCDGCFTAAAIPDDPAHGHLRHGWRTHARARGIRAARWADSPADPGPTCGWQDRDAECLFARHLLRRSKLVLCARTRRGDCPLKRGILVLARTGIGGGLRLRHVSALAAHRPALGPL